MAAQTFTDPQYGFTLSWPEADWWRVPLPGGDLPLRVKLMRAGMPDATCSAGAGAANRLQGLPQPLTPEAVTDADILRGLSAVYPNARLVKRYRTRLGEQPALLVAYGYTLDLVATQVAFSGWGVAAVRDGTVYVAECNALASRFPALKGALHQVLGSLRLPTGK